MYVVRLLFVGLVCRKTGTCQSALPAFQGIFSIPWYEQIRPLGCVHPYDRKGFQTSEILYIFLISGAMRCHVSQRRSWPIYCVATSGQHNLGQFVTVHFYLDRLIQNGGAFHFLLASFGFSAILKLKLIIIDEQNSVGFVNDRGM